MDKPIVRLPALLGLLAKGTTNILGLKLVVIVLAVKFVATAAMPRMTFVVGMAKEYGPYQEDEGELQQSGLGRGMSCWICACKPGLWLWCAEWAAKGETRQRGWLRGCCHCARDLGEPKQKK